jgi:hypothetical protein
VGGYAGNSRRIELPVQSMRSMQNLQYSMICWFSRKSLVLRAGT